MIEERAEDEWLTMEAVIRENDQIFRQCRRNQVNYVWIDERYEVDLEL